MLNNREIASLFWLALLLAAAMLNGKVQSSLRDVVRTATQLAVMGLLLFFVAYAGLEVWLAAKIGYL